MSCTMSGVPCQRWDVNSPHTTRTRPSDPDDLASNYCRDPNDTGAPWCYTINPALRWKLCPIAKCWKHAKTWTKLQYEFNCDMFSRICLYIKKKKKKKKKLTTSTTTENPTGTILNTNTPSCHNACGQQTKITFWFFLFLFVCWFISNLDTQIPIDTKKKMFVL